MKVDNEIERRRRIQKKGKEKIEETRLKKGGREGQVNGTDRKGRRGWKKKEGVAFSVALQ